MKAIKTLINRNLQEAETWHMVDLQNMAKAASAELDAYKDVAKLLKEAVDSHFLVIDFAMKCHEALYKVKE